MKKNKEVHIIGGGPAGLASAYFLRERGCSIKLYEGSNHFGGNARTFVSDAFRYDSGAHRFHDKIPEITHKVKELLGNSLQLVSAPSQIYFDGSFIDFPLRPGNLLKHLGIRDFTKASISVVNSKLQGRNSGESFKARVERVYGKDISGKFLIPYSEKLWGAPADQLSPDISGGRLKGLNLGGFFFDAIFKKKNHLDGSFYYPKEGIGQLAQALVDQIGPQYCQTRSMITGVQCSENVIESITINDKDTVPVDELISTLPLTQLTRMLGEVVPENIVSIATKLRFRDVLLVAVFLDTPKVTSNATLYFPEKEYIFTRVVEPKNRSKTMAPARQTMLVAEVPLSSPINEGSIDSVCRTVCDQLTDIGLINKSDILRTEHKILHKAYPILTQGYEADVNQLVELFEPYENLHLLGRNGLFAYSHIHNIMFQAKELANMICEKGHF